MSKKPNYVFDDELYHYGILGQKWGERRYQNEDGSWTPEGRERYGKGDSRVDKREAKVKYDAQKYKADLRSKAKQDRDTRTANEERHRIKQQLKTEKLIRKEQEKLNKAEKKKNKNMSSDELKEAISRLDLQIEYNKKLTLAKNPNSALAKADRFFEGPTGKMVRQIAVNALPDLIKSTAGKIVDKQLSEKKDPERDMLEKAEKIANIRKANAQAASFEATANKTLSDIQKNSSNDEKITQDLIQLPRAYPQANRSSDIPKTTPVEISTIGKTVSPQYNVGRTVAPQSNIGRTVAPSATPGTPGGRRLYAWEIKRKKKT